MSQRTDRHSPEAEPTTRERRTFQVSHRSFATDHPVLEVLRQRGRDGSVPGTRRDGHRVVLAIEGGGMRGAVSAAMLGALDDHGLRNAFDAVHGTSSGAVNAAYFLAGTTWYPLSIYYDDLASARFLDPRRVLRGRPLMDIDYAYEEVVRERKPLDHEAVLASPVELGVTVTDVDELRTELVTRFTGPADLHSALRASAWLPIALHGTASFRGRRAVDGGVLTAHPRTLSMASGATHVLSLSTKPVDVPRGTISRGTRFAAGRLDSLRAGLGRGYLQSLRELAQAQPELARARVGASSGPRVLDVAPLAGTPELARHELRPWRIMDACRSAYALMHTLVAGGDEDDLRAGRISAVPRLTIVDKTR